MANTALDDLLNNNQETVAKGSALDELLASPKQPETVDFEEIKKTFQKNRPKYPEIFSEADRPKREAMITGIKQAIQEPVYAAGELFGLVSPENVQKMKDEWQEALKKSSTGARLGYYTTQIGGTGLIGKGLQVLRGAPAVLEEGLPFLKRTYEGIKSGAGAGAVYGVASPTGEKDWSDYIKSKFEQAGLGALGGGLLGGAGAAIFGKRAISTSDLARQWSRNLSSGIESVAFIDEISKSQEAIESSARKELEDAQSAIQKMTTGKTAETEARIETLNRNVADATTKLTETARQQADHFRSLGTAQGEEAARQIEKNAADQVAVFRQRSGFIAEQANRRINAAQAKLDRFGFVKKELTDIFQPLRDRTQERFNVFKETQSEIDAERRAVQQNIVADNEARGITIDQMPRYKGIKATLDRIFDPARAPDIEQIRDPGKKKLYERVANTILNRRVEITPDQARIASSRGYDVQTVPDQNGNPRYFRTFKSSFEAIDDARRFMGQVFRGKPPEGYEAVSGETEKKLYDELTALQEQYVGETTQKSLQLNWSTMERKLEEFENKYGRALLEHDEKSPYFTTDVADLGKTFFRTRNSVQAALDMSSQEGLVENVARDYVRNQLDGMKADDVKRFITSDAADWLSHPNMKEIRAEVIDYARQLERAERGREVVKKKLPEFAGEIKSISETAPKTAEEARAAAAKTAEERAAGITTEAEKQAEAVRKAAGKQAESIRKTSQAEIAARTKEADTAAREVFAEAVKRPKVARDYKALQNFASLVAEREDIAAKTGVKETVYTTDQLVNKMKEFLRTQAAEGTVPSDILSREAEKLNRLSRGLTNELKQDLIKSQLATLGGQVITGKLPSALKTGASILGGGL